MNTENSVLNSPVSFASAAVSYQVCDPGCWNVLQDASTHILDQNEVPSDVLLLKGQQIVRILLEPGVANPLPAGIFLPLEPF